MSSRLLIAALVSTVTLACGGSTSQDSSTGGSAGSGGSTGGTAGTGGATGGTAGISGGTGGASCDGYEDETPPGSVTLRYQNATGAPIYLGGGNTCDPTPLFDLDGPDGPVQLMASGCGHTCEALQSHGNYCAGACMMPPVIMIAPGGHYDETWLGTVYELETMPEKCYFEPDFAPTSCDRRVIAPKGSYAAVVQAGSTLSCYDSSTCSCTPDASGSCQIPYGGTPDGKQLAAKASFEMPGASLVTITFQ